MVETQWNDQNLASKFKNIVTIQPSKVNYLTNISYPKDLGKKPTPSSEIVVVSDANSTEDEEDFNEMKYWHTVCQAASVSGQVGDNVVTMKDYVTLTPGSYISDSVINFGLRISVQKFKTPLVLVLSTDFAARLSSWSSNDPDRFGLLTWATGAGLWTGGGARYVLLPVIWKDHFYLLVSVLDFHSPTIQILESIGGDIYAQAPPITKQFIQFLQFIHVREQQSEQKFQVHIPPVPHQSRGSNDCGMFLLHFAEKILENPTEFEIEVSKGNLESWFDPEILLESRQELVEFIKDTAIQQHKPGGELEKSLCLLPLPNPEVIKKAVCINEINKINK